MVPVMPVDNVWAWYLGSRYQRGVGPEFYTVINNTEIETHKSAAHLSY